MSGQRTVNGGRLLRRVVMISGLTAAFVAAPASLEAQSLFGSRGLGVVTTPVDGRAAALGGLGLALPGPGAALLNPADAADVQRRGVIVGIQPSTTELETAAGTDNVSATRFPLVQFMLPVGNRTVITAGYGSFLDQNWGAISRSTAPLGDDTVTAIDRVTSTGGIAQGRAGVSYGITDNVTLGASIGLLTGSATRTARRTFEDDDIGLAPFETSVKTSYTAPLATLGARAEVGSMVLVSAAVTWMGDMTSSVEGVESEISMPLQVMGGASAQMLEDLLITVASRWSAWGDTETDDATAEDVLEIGGGIEWSGISIARRAIPVRLGGRWGGQPFSFGDAAPSESAISLGIGARLAGGEEIPAALVDLGVERGTRGDTGDNGIGESFWRMTLSISLFSQ